MNHRNPYDQIHTALDTNRIRLEARRWQVSHGLSDQELGMIAGARLDMVRDEMARTMVTTLMATVASKKYEVKTVRFPADWVQACKRRWLNPAWRLGRWALKRWPVKYTEVTMEASAYYPEIAIPDHQAFVDIVFRRLPRSDTRTR